jgi:hypothetical protein
MNKLRLIQAAQTNTQYFISRMCSEEACVYACGRNPARIVRGEVPKAAVL